MTIKTTAASSEARAAVLLASSTHSKANPHPDVPALLAPSAEPGVTLYLIPPRAVRAMGGSSASPPVP